MRRLNVPEAESLLTNGYVYLDVRSVPEFDTGHVAGAFNVPWHEPGPDGSRENSEFIDEVSAVIARGQPVVVGCAQGVRSLAAAARLAAYGYVEVCELLPGTDGQRDPFGRVREPGLRAAGVPLVTATLPGRSHAEIRALRRGLAEARPLATSDERRRVWSIVGKLPVSVSFYRGPEMRVECAHPMVTRAMGRDVEGLSYEEAFPELVRFGYYEQMRRAFASGEPAVGSEARVTRKGADGRDEPSYWNYSYLPVPGPDGAMEGVVSCHIDVTAEVQARQNLEALTRRYMSLIQATSQTVWTTAPNGETLGDSPTWRALTGQSFDEWTGFGWANAIHPDDRARVQAEWQKAIADERLYEVEYRVRTASGAYIWSYARAVPVRDASGTIYEWIGTNSDITAQKAAESARARAEEERSALLGRETKLRAEAEAANRSKDEFLAMLGHELRNPLAPIVTALELMKLEPSDAHVREREIIERHVRHLGRLVDDLLDVSRITRGRVDLRRERVALHEVVQRAAEMASPLLEERRHYLTMSVPKHGLEVDGDPARLAQVVANLLTNAAKYTEPHGRIRVEAEASGQEVVLRVSDTGIGILGHRLPQIFEPFVQEPQSLARSHGGLGLGLAIVRSLVELHGGRVEAKSEGAGRGSTFVITLPLASALAPRRAAAPDPTPASAPARGSLRVLVVDDNEDAASLLASWLGRRGFEASVANDGFEAITLARRVQPALALLDLGLPVLDGYELAERLRAEPDLAELKLIAVTGYGQEQDRERTRQAGFHAHLVKPVNLAELAALLERFG